MLSAKRQSSTQSIAGKRYFIALALVLFALSSTGSSQTVSEPTTPDQLFDRSVVWDVHLQFEIEQWRKLQPPKDTNWDIHAALRAVMHDAMMGGNFHSKKSSRPGLAGYTGVDHQYGSAVVTIAGKTLPNVAVRYKGNGTFLSGYPSGKSSYKIDFNKYNDTTEFCGLIKLNLNNNISDASMLREVLSYELFRDAGIAAPRTGWAKVFLTVEGQCDHKFTGLYSIVEQVDKRFLKRHYGNSKGLLLKPSTFGALRYFGEQWAAYETAFNPKTDGSPQQQKTLIEFCRLVHVSNDDEFSSQLEHYLDIPQFLNFLAVNVLLSNMDSFLGGSQNHYVYLERESNKFQVLPWDLDHSFGAFDLLVFRLNLVFG